MQNLSERDRAIIWHPFTQHLTDPCPIPIVKAQGAYLFSEDGEKYIDAISSWWTNVHGHAHPHIVEMITKQAQTLEHVMFADFTHEPAILLAERLLPILPRGLSRFFYSDNGSTAVEIALKIAFQYSYNNSPEKPKRKIIAFRGAYHGDTFGAMSAAVRSTHNRPFWPFLFDVDFIDPPYHGKEDVSLKQLEELIGKDDTACFIFEPLVQGFSGMVMHSASGLSQLMKKCRDHHILLIADEVMTGFGRTGPLFASDQLSEPPDMICLSKSLTGGALPLALTVCTEELYEGFLSEERSRAFLWGHTYTGNPLGCAAALASLDLLLTPQCHRQRVTIEAAHQSFKQRWGSQWKRCDVLGTILALEYFDPSDTRYFSKMRDRLSRHFLNHRIVIRPFGNVVHVMPPYCIEEDDLNAVYQSLLESLTCL